MSRSPIPLFIEDISSFATAMRQNWPAEAPSHTATLALIARAAGYRNHQHLKANAEQDSALDKAAEKRIKDALRVFSEDGMMIRWPQKTSLQRLCMVWFWSRLPGRIDLSEKDVNAILKEGEAFGDHVLLRRSLIDHKLVKRSIDGRIYRKIEQRPSLEERQFLRTLSARHMTRNVEIGLDQTLS